MDAKTSLMLLQLERFVKQRPGFDAANYDTLQSLRADRRAAVFRVTDKILCLVRGYGSSFTK